MMSSAALERPVDRERSVDVDAARRRRLRRGTAAVLFVAILGTLAATRGYHQSAALVVRGTVDRPLRVRLAWDVGDGLGPRDGEDHVLGVMRPMPYGRHRLVIERLPGGSAARPGGAVRFGNLRTPAPVPLEAFEAHGRVRRLPRTIALLAPGATAAYEGEFDRVFLDFAKKPGGGTARILLDGVEQAVVSLRSIDDLAAVSTVVLTSEYAGGAFERALPLPRARIRALAIESLDSGRPLPPLELRLESGGRVVPLAAEPGVDGRLVVPDLPPANRAFNGRLLALQAALALLLAWLVVELAWLPSTLGVDGWRAAARVVFLADGRWLFWAMFVGAATVFVGWHLAFWPAFMTADSLDGWLQTKRVAFYNWNPVVHSLYVFGLTQLWDSPAAVAAFQVAATAALGSAVFWAIWRAGLPLGWVLPFWVAFALSPPVGVYNLLVWKDVPFCLLVVLAACVVYHLARRARAGVPVVPGRRALAVAAATFVVLCTIRHNGKAYLVVLPALLFAARLVPWRVGLRFVTLAFAMWMGVEYGVGYAIGAHQATNYRIITLSMQLNPWAALLRDPVGYYSDAPNEDARRLRRFMAPTDLKRLYDPLTVTPLVYGPNRRDEITDRETRKITRRFVRRTLENLHIVLAERVYLFLATLGFRTWAYSSNLWQPAHGVDEPQTLSMLRDEPKSLWLRAVARRILRGQDRFAGLSRGSFLFWNAFLPLLLVTAVFLLYGWLPVSALACTVVLTQAAVIFLLGISNDFRYVYFLHLFAYFLPPLVLLELCDRRRRGRVAAATDAERRAAPG